MLSQQQAQIMPLPSHLALLQHWLVALIRLFDEIVCVITLLLQLRQNRLQIRRRSLARRYLLLCLGYDASQLVQQLLLHVRYTFTCVLWHLVQAQHTLTAHWNLSTHSQQPRVAIWSDSRHCQSTTVQLHKKTLIITNYLNCYDVLFWCQCPLQRLGAECRSSERGEVWQHCMCGCQVNKSIEVTWVVLEDGSIYDNESVKPIHNKTAAYAYAAHRFRAVNWSNHCV